MNKLDDLDIYTRTQIKNEIATERINYVTSQRIAIESALNARIDVKATLQDIENKYDPIIKKILANIPNYEPEPI